MGLSRVKLEQGRREKRREKGEWPMAEDKIVGIGIRILESMKNDLDNAAWAEGVSLTQLVLEGITNVLTSIKKKHGGTIPERPTRRSPTYVPSTAAGATAPAPKKPRGK
jgi:hypothetical protein